MLRFKDVQQHPIINEYIEQCEITCKAIEMTEHGHRHLNLVSQRAMAFAKECRLNDREIELAGIAAYCHDIANFLSRSNHHYFGGILFNSLFLNELEPNELAILTQAIMNHHKKELKLTNTISAILIVADKSDVHRDRVIITDINKIKANIHQRVNYATTENKLDFDAKSKTVTLNIKIDTEFVELMEYFEIFTERMAYCREASQFLGWDFNLIINDTKLL